MATKSAPKDAAPDATEAEQVYVVAVNGNMLNLFTDVWITKDPKKVPLDDFIKGQVEAGKLEIVQP